MYSRAFAIRVVIAEREMMRANREEDEERRGATHSA